VNYTYVSNEFDVAIESSFGVMCLRPTCMLFRLIGIAVAVYLPFYVNNIVTIQQEVIISHNLIKDKDTDDLIRNFLYSNLALGI
jgi:membrane protein insertase Oxa1/YidC/SpoIIIJ